MENDELLKNYSEFVSFREERYGKFTSLLIPL